MSTKPRLLRVGPEGGGSLSPVLSLSVGSTLSSAVGKLPQCPPVQPPVLVKLTRPRSDALRSFGPGPGLVQARAPRLRSLTRLQALRLPQRL